MCARRQAGKISPPLEKQPQNMWVTWFVIESKLARS